MGNGLIFTIGIANSGSSLSFYFLIDGICTAPEMIPTPK